MGAEMLIPLALSFGTKLLGSKLSPNKSTSTTTANLDPSQTALHAQIADILKNALASGPAIPAWQKNQAAGQVNAGYAAAAPKLEAEFAKRGFETSGKMGSTLRGLEVGRINALSSSQNQLAGAAQQRYDEMLRLAQQFTNPMAHTTTSTGPSNLGSTVSGIGSDLSTMLLLRNLLGKGGGGAIPSNGGYGGGDFDYSGFG